MGDSPTSDKFVAEEVSKPIAELDDHRFQQTSLPPADPTSPHTRSHTRRGTATSLAGSVMHKRPDLLHVNDALLTQGMAARDFEEQAVVDDDRSVNEEQKYHKLVAGSSPMHRRGTFRRPHRDTHEPERHNKSRSSSKSSRSISPPDSVEAFAEQRRRDRATTLTSIAASELDLRLTRTASGGTHRHRPGTASIRTHKTSRTNTSSEHGSVEEDVCFPVPEENGRVYSIDFEELDDFVAEQRASGPSQDNATQTRLFHDLRRLDLPTAVKVITEASEANSEDETQKEKLDGVQDEKDQIKRTASFEPRHQQAVNRWTFFSSEVNDPIYAPELGDLLMPKETFRDLFELGPDGGFWWLDILNPSKDEVYAIAKAFGLHNLTREDILQQESREKVELFRNYYFVCFRSFHQGLPENSDDYLEPLNFYFVAFREGVLSFTHSPNPHAANVRKRLDRLSDYVSVSPDWITYALIDDIVDAFQPIIRDVERETDVIEDNVFTVRPEDSKVILRQIGECRKKTMHLLRLMGGKADVIKGFAKRCNEQYSIAPRGDVGVYLSDIQDHVVTMLSNLAHAEKILSRSHSNYLAQISVDNISQGNRVNMMLGKVTFIATILIPLNLVTGLFGMNVKVPGGEQTSMWWWWGILIGIFSWIALATTIAKKLRFI